MSVAAAQRADAVIGIGASAGGFDPLCMVLSQLKPGLRAPVLVVVHLNAAAPSILDRILGRCTALPVEFAYNGCRLQNGHVYVAPPDRHMVVRDDFLELEHSATVNAVRPSVDVTFESMASHFGPRCVGVILSGTRDDGAAGMLAIKRAGGHTIVQDPEEAVFPGMPTNALYVVKPDDVAGADRIGEMASKAIDQLPPVGVPAETDHPQGDPDVDDPPGGEVVHPPGHPSELACPECGGVLWEQPEPPHDFRCRVGHAYSPDSLVSRHSQKLEEVLWSAVVALEERADLFRRVSRRLQGQGAQKMHRRYSDSADLATSHAAALRSLIEGTENPPSPTGTD
ncbi:MAG TPA: chemotaxis protein CheB [Acidimicrobiales bacterium]|nr:chemotaxis protein CheB [Acidimicrobiales bacterium]